MKALIEFLPLVAFLVAYYLRDVYTATAALMIAMPLMLLALWVLTRKLSTLQLLSTAMVLVFGSLTLFLHDDRFIKWKPTVFLWAVALVLAVTYFTAKEPLVKRFLAPLAEGRRVAASDWRTLNWAWVVCYAVLGGVNLAVAYTASQPVWVNFKVFGLTALLMLFIVGQAIWLQRRPALEGAGA